MEKDLLLQIHILGGWLSLGFCGAGLVSVFIKRTNFYLLLLRTNIIFFILQLISGTGLVLLQVFAGSLVSFCIKFGLYTFVVGSTIALLFFKIKSYLALPHHPIRLDITASDFSKHYQRRKLFYLFCSLNRRTYINIWIKYLFPDQAVFYNQNQRGCML